MTKCDVCGKEIDANGSADYCLFHHSNMIHVLHYKNAPVTVLRTYLDEDKGEIVTELRSKIIIHSKWKDRFEVKDSPNA